MIIASQTIGIIFFIFFTYFLIFIIVFRAGNIKISSRNIIFKTSFI